jgi:hypothetical protein
MKKILKNILSVVDSFNRARAAAYFTRLGRPDLAKKIMTEQ